MLCAHVRSAAWLLVALLVLQMAAVPTGAWLPTAQRESESESAPEESSKATDPEALISASSARARRIQADRLARLDHSPPQERKAYQTTLVGWSQSAEFLGRNGRGCALRC